MALGCARIGLGWILGTNFFTQMVVRHRPRLPRAVVASPSLEGFESHIGVVLRTCFHSDLAVLAQWLELIDPF